MNTDSRSSSAAGPRSRVLGKPGGSGDCLAGRVLVITAVPRDGSAFLMLFYPADQCQEAVPEPGCCFGLILARCSGQRAEVLPYGLRRSGQATGGVRSRRSQRDVPERAGDRAFDPPGSAFGVQGCQALLGTGVGDAGAVQGAEQVAQSSDVLIVALPLNIRTRHLVNAELIGLMRPGAFVVNVGRGSVVDEDAVAAALDTGRLGGYATDVFAMEDWLLPGRPPAIADRLLRHPRTLFTPHLGSAVDEVRRRMSLQAARQVRLVLEGQRPDHAVNQPWPVRPGAPR
jgi:hypothetical protein